MNLEEVLDRLKQHSEHYRVLPANAANALVSLIGDIEATLQPNDPDPNEVRDTGVVARAKTRKKAAKRSKR